LSARESVRASVGMTMETEAKAKFKGSNQNLKSKAPPFQKREGWATRKFRVKSTY
jgi:hypothetical protein